MRPFLRVGVLGAALASLAIQGSDVGVSPSSLVLEQPAAFLSTYIESAEDVKDVDNGNSDGEGEDASTPEPEVATTEAPEPTPAPSSETTVEPKTTQETTTESPEPTSAPGPQTDDTKKTTTWHWTTVEPKSSREPTTSTKSTESPDWTTAKPDVDKTTTESPDSDEDKERRVVLPRWVPFAGVLLCCLLSVCACSFGAQYLRDRQSQERAIGRRDDMPRLAKNKDAPTASLDAPAASAAPLMAAAQRAFSAAGPAPVPACSEVIVVVKAASDDGTDMEFKHVLKCSARLNETCAAWALAHGVPENAVGLETCAGQALGLTSTPEELGWEAGSEVMVYAVPLDDDYLGGNPGSFRPASFKQSSVKPVEPRVA